MYRPFYAVLSAALVFCALTTSSARASALILEPPPKPAAGFFQEVTSACTVETNVSPAYTKKVAGMVRAAEEKFYKLFRLTPDLMNGVSKEPFDVKARIPGDIMHRMGIRAWVDIRVYRNYEQFADEWFDLAEIKDPQQRATIGLPGAYYSFTKEYNGKLWLRKIRSFVSNRDDDELERTLLHEMGHLFVMSYMLEFAGNPPKGQESQKRGTPAWLGEGTAQLFENLWSNAASAKKARLRQQAMIYEAVKVGDSYPFAEFINITNAHNLAAVANDPLRATINYAQSASVMDYMVNVDGARFFNFLQNLRELHFIKNLSNPDKNHIPELYSFQNEAFRKAFVVGIEEVEGYWKKNVKKIMEDMLKKQPELHYWIGEYYLVRKKDKANDLKRAEEEFNIAMKEAPAKGEGYLGAGRMFVRKHDYAAAVPLFEKAVKFMPKDEDAHFYLGLAQLNTGQAKEAVASFDASLAIFPRNANSLAGLATAALQAKQYDKAIKAYDDAYEASRSPQFLFQKGQAAFFAKNYQLAQTGFNNYVQIFPNDAQGQLWYALAAWRLGQKEFAIKKLEEAAKLQPNDGMIATALKMAQAGETVYFQSETPDEAAVAKKDENPGDKTDATKTDPKTAAVDKKNQKPKNKEVFRIDEEE